MAEIIPVDFKKKKENKKLDKAINELINETVSNVFECYKDGKFDKKKADKLFLND